MPRARPPSESPPSIQPADPAEAAACSRIERAASVLFDETAHAWLAGQAAQPDAYARAAAAGDLLVAREAAPAPASVEARGRPVGFVLMRPLGPDALYIGELAVLPSHQGRRLGARLLDAAGAAARARGLAWLVLRTFRDVPWNAPYYRRLGFAAPPPGLSAAALDEMARIADREAAHGLSERVRIFMARAVPPPGQSSNSLARMS